LLVDTGFAGASDVILSYSDGQLFGTTLLHASTARGALQGAQLRVQVTCTVEALAMRTALAAICTDLTSLALPSGFDGVAGLNFLSRFRGWGARKTPNGAWSFFLEAG
jgi:hypothetical protein